MLNPGFALYETLLGLARTGDPRLQQERLERLMRDRGYGQVVEA